MQRRHEAGAAPGVREAEALLEVADLKTHFPLRGSFVDRLLGREAGHIKAVDGVSFSVRRGEVLGVVGESGSGKTTLGRSILRLVEPTGGRIVFGGRDVSRLGEREFRPLRKRMQMVFQDPHASLNPAMTIAQSVGHPLTIHGVTGDRDEMAGRVAASLERVGLVPVENFMNKYPGDLSGGQKQRAVLARAIILGPELLIADEPVSMLDMSVRAKILELMLELKRDLDLTYIYITHDLATAKFFCDRIAIMYLGKIIEIGPARACYEDPKHPYTVSLLNAVPEPDPAKRVPRDLPRGEVPDAVEPPLGCYFHPRCPRAFEVCGWEARDLRDMLERRWAEMPEEDFEREQQIVGDLAALDEATTPASLVPGHGHRPEDVMAIIEEMRRAHPDDPFWRGVARVAPSPRGVDVHFNRYMDPRLVPAGEAKVACHLYDEEALAMAEDIHSQDGAAAR